MINVYANITQLVRHNIMTASIYYTVYRIYITSICMYMYLLSRFMVF